MDYQDWRKKALRDPEVAAEHITALEAENKKLRACEKDRQWQMKRNNEIGAENAMLRSGVAQMSEHIEEYKATVAMLREALFNIMRHGPDELPHQMAHAALSRPASDWLAKHDAEVEARSHDAGIVEGVARVWAAIQAFKNTMAHAEFDAWLVIELNKAQLRRAAALRGKEG